MTSEFDNIVVLHSYDFSLSIINAIDIIGNIANLMQKRFKKIINQQTEKSPQSQFVLHDYCYEFAQLKYILERENQDINPNVKILFLCININAESLEIIKLSYPESEQFHYKILSEDECLEQFPNNFAKIDISDTASTSSASSYNISPTLSCVTLFDNTISTILPNQLYLSDYIGASNLEELQKHKITNIINITDTIENYFEDELDINNNSIFKYLKIAIPDALNVKITDYFDQTFQFIDDAIIAGNGILVHCFAGKSRSAAIVIGYIMKTRKMKFEEALRFVQNIRPCIDPNFAFCAQLMSYNPTSE